MTERWYVHIVDPDCARRATMARQLYALGIHAEIYETLDELIGSDPDAGALLINADQPPLAEADMIGRLASCANALPVAFFAADPCPERIVTAVLAGARDYLQWPCAPGALLFKVERLARTGVEMITAERLRRNSLRLVEGLSRREREVLSGVVAGGSNKDIAGWLGISSRTVEIHRSNMMSHLKARSLAQAVRIGLEAGLADAPIHDHSYAAVRGELELAA